jgi:hypothetical protein
MKKALVLFGLLALVVNMGLFADDIKWSLNDPYQLITITSVSTAVANQIKIEYTAKKAIPVMTILIKCFYKDGSNRTYDNEERGVKSGGSRSPTVFAHSPSSITRVEITLKQLAKKDIEVLEKTEEYLDIMSKLLQGVPSNKVQELVRHMETVSGILNTVNKGISIYSTVKDMAEVVSWGNAYKDARTDEDKIRAGNGANKKMLELIPKLASYAGGPLYGQIIPVVCKAVSNAYNFLDRRAQNIDLTWWYLDDAFHHAYYGNETRFGNLVIEMKSNGANVQQVTKVLEELQAMEQMTGKQVF